MVDKIDSTRALLLWNKACDTKWNKAPVWIHGDFASGNLLVKDGRLSGVIDFGGMAVGDPACDLVIAWTLLDKKSRKYFIDSIGFDHDTLLRAKAWALWKATYELCNLDQNSDLAHKHQKIINDVLEDII